jgi:hypothetical protein
MVSWTQHTTTKKIMNQGKMRDFQKIERRRERKM